MQVNSLNNSQVQASPAFAARPSKEVRKAINTVVKEATKNPVTLTINRFLSPLGLGAFAYDVHLQTIHPTSFGAIDGICLLWFSFMSTAIHIGASRNLSKVAESLKAKGFKPEEVKYGLKKALGKTGIPFVSRAIANIFQRKTIAQLAGTAANDNHALALAA